MKTFRTKPTTQQVRQFNKKALTIRRLSKAYRDLVFCLAHEKRSALLSATYLTAAIGLIESRGLLEELQQAWAKIDTGEG